MISQVVLKIGINQVNKYDFKLQTSMLRPDLCDNGSVRNYYH